MSQLQFLYPSAEHFEGLRSAVGQVASERIYLNRTEAPPRDKYLAKFTKALENHWPIYLALEGERVVGWADITPLESVYQTHRGGLGMGVVDGYRGKGVGEKLLSLCLEHALKIGLEKVELHVYTDNLRALHLYRKLGFSESGLVKHFRKLEGRYFDAIQMEKFLTNG